MGIKHFFPWLKNNFKSSIYYIGKNRLQNGYVHKVNKPSNLTQKLDLVNIDNLLIDLNGMIHTSAQKIFKYGKYEEKDDIYNVAKTMGILQGKVEDRILTKHELYELVFSDICSNIVGIINILKPAKRLVIHIDGPAPKAKQNQQRQRRFRAAYEKENKNNISLKQCNQEIKKEWKFQSSCLTGDTLVSLMGGRCRPIKNLMVNDLLVTTINKKFRSVEYAKQTGFYKQGKKDTICITFQDGRTLCCTSDHQIMTSDGKWKRAEDLTNEDSVVMGNRGVIDIPSNDEKGYILCLGKLAFSFDSDYERERTLAFCRILGITLTDGCSAEYCRKSTGKMEPYGCVTLGSIPDAVELLADIKLVTDQDMSSQYSDEKSFRVNLPAILADAINQSGIPLGKKIDKERTFPSFILEDNCPLSMIREFFGGYFGGDGHAPGFSTSAVDGQITIRKTAVSHSCKKEYQKDLRNYMLIMSNLLKKIGVKNRQCKTQKMYHSKKSYHSNGDFVEMITIKSAKTFVEKVGFRFCHAKAIRAEAIASYERLKDNVRKNREEFLTIALEKFDSGINRKNSYDETLDEFTGANVIIHPFCIPQYQTFNKAIRSGRICKPKSFTGLSMGNYLIELGAFRFFGDHKGGTDRVENTPTMKLKVIDIRESDTRMTYDISIDSDTHSFLANGIGVHNCMSPGTKYMEAMSSYVKTYFISYCKQNKLEFIFSDDKYPGEGEHKCMKFAIENEWRINGRISKGKREEEFPYSESYCIYGNDADLIMLTIGTHISNFYILRDDMYNEGNFYFLNIDTIKAKLVELLKWNNKPDICHISLLNDFIFTCFMVGNDFLPNIPSLEILQGGIDLMINIYKKVGEKHNYLTYYKKNFDGTRSNNLRFNKAALTEFLYHVSEYEKELFQSKYNSKDFFPDDLLNDSTCNNNVNMPVYKKKYYLKKLNVDYSVQNISYNIGHNIIHNINEPTISYGCFSVIEKENDLIDICDEYLEGLHWVLKYYIKRNPSNEGNLYPLRSHYDVPSWNWCYNYHYAPFASDLYKYVGNYRFKSYVNTKPHLPYEQLLGILPPASKELLPKDMRSIFTNEKLKQFYPESIILDKSGKRKEWEAITIVPVIDQKLLKKEYKKVVKEMRVKNPDDLKRNIHSNIIYYKCLDNFSI